LINTLFEGKPMNRNKNAVIERLAKDNGRSKWGQVIADPLMPPPIIKMS